MTQRYLPEWATAQEAAEWLQAETGERWPLPRLIESGLMPHVWLTPDKANPAVLSAVFDGRHEGFLAPLVFAGDTGRLCVDRTGAVSMTRSPTGELVRFTPPVPFTTDDLRFNAKDVRQLPAPASAPPAWGDDCPISPNEYLTLRAWAVEVLGDRWPATRPDPDADMECAVALEHETLTAAQLTACRLLRDAATLCHFSRGIPIDGGGCIPRVSEPLTDMLMMYVIQHSAEMAAHLPDGKRAALLRLVDTLRPRVIGEPTPVNPESVAFNAPATMPVPADREPAVNDQPLPLTTGNVAHCFDGLRWTEAQWRKPLGDKPKWLQACIAIPGQRGVSETRWNPVLIAAVLVKDGYINANSARARFQTKPVLQPWLEAWKTYEADFIDSD